MNTTTQTQMAQFSLKCATSRLLLERLLQILRYRGFSVINFSSVELNDQETEVSLLVKGQAKLTTLQKSFETLIEVQECYFTEDQAKLATLLDMGLNSLISPTNIPQSASYAAEGA